MDLFWTRIFIIDLSISLKLNDSANVWQSKFDYRLCLSSIPWDFLPSAWVPLPCWFFYFMHLYDLWSTMTWYLTKRTFKLEFLWNWISHICPFIRLYMSLNWQKDWFVAGCTNIELKSLIGINYSQFRNVLKTEF